MKASVWRPSRWLAVLILFGLISPATHGAEPEAEAMVRVKGSDTMYELSRAWIARYHKEHPQIWVELIYGRGSSNGIASLINGHLEVALSSRMMNASERHLSQKRSRLQPVHTPVGLDAVVLVTHRDNPLPGLTMDQISRIYQSQGTLEHWTQLGTRVPGCEDQRIMRLSRKNNSGTFDLFRDWFVAGARRLHRDTYAIETTKDLMEKVVRSPCALGYGSLALTIDGVKPLCIQGRHLGGCIAPTPESIRQGSYPLRRYLYMITLGPPSGETAHFIQWVKGPEGQEILGQKGFFPLPP